MPNVLRFDGLRVGFIRTIIDRPMFVIGRGCEAVFDLNCPAGPAEIRENYGFSRREIRQMLAVLTEDLTALCKAWEQIHGIA